MKTKYKFFGILVSVLFLLCASTVWAQDNAVISAMKKEVDRNKAELKIDKLQPPFFIGYSVIDFNTLEVSASLGALSTSLKYHNRGGSPTLLVGDYNRNNLNFRTSQNYPSNVTIEDNPVAIATAIWSHLDRVYKSAAETYEAKLAAIRQQKIQEDELNLPDLEKISPVVYIKDPITVNLDKVYWENYAKKSSEILKKYPVILTSQVNITVKNIMYHHYNTENTQIAMPLPYYKIHLNVSALTDDGQELYDNLFIEYSSFEQMPELNVFIDSCEKFIAEFITLLNAPIIDEAYSGPVLFEGEAIANALQTHFFNSQSLIAKRKPVSEGNQRPQGNNMEMMKNKKIISRSLTIKSLSGTQIYNNKKLDGYYTIDADGVAPHKELILVENGVLKNMLNGRIPTKMFPNSNGHSRMNFNLLQSNITPGNIQLSSNDTYSMDELKKKLLDAAKEEDLEYAYIVRRFRGNMPLFTYKVYVKDGREELVRGVTLPDFNLKSYKRILGASEKEFFYNANTMGSIVTYIVPQAILFEEMEVMRNNDITFKTPFIVNKPTASK